MAQRLEKWDSVVLPSVGSVTGVGYGGGSEDEAGKAVGVCTG